MAKLKAAPASVAAPVQTQAPTVAASTDPKVPFAVAAPGAVVAQTGKQNLVQKRKDKITAALAAGSPFTYKAVRPGVPFQCICGAEGKNAIVLLDKDEKEVLVGSNCLRYTGVELPARERKAREATAPGVSKQQKFSESLGKFVAPFRFVRKQEGPFACLCGGRGINQLVVADANGAEFSVGATCIASVPGVELPKAPRQSAVAPAVAGLKGAVPPSFSEVG